jgi:hypothetical protein
MKPRRPPKHQSKRLMDAAARYMQTDSNIYSNLQQEIIITTEDKVRICLMQHLERMAEKKAWLVPLGIFLTILVVFPTTTFHGFLVSAETWQAIFLICGTTSLIWLVAAFWRATRSSSLDDVVSAIKRSSLPPAAK